MKSFLCQWAFSAVSASARPEWGRAEWLWAGLVLLESRVLQQPCHKWDGTNLKQRFPMVVSKVESDQRTPEWLQSCGWGRGTGYMENWDPHLVLQNAFLRSWYRLRIFRSLYMKLFLPLPKNGRKANKNCLSGRDKLRDWDWHIYPTIYKIDN